MTACATTVDTPTPRRLEPLPVRDEPCRRAAVATVAVAYSGGRDSTALLHATLRAARDLGLHVAALHIHHGLSERADDWLEHCRLQCQSWAAEGWPVRFLSERVTLAPAGGRNIEARAREARYQALVRLAGQAGASVVLLAHHRTDQAETFLLQALRGGGVAGLASMPQQVERHGVRWMRPWLRRTRASIESYVQAHGLSYVDDESNTDRRYARNRLRLELWPALLQAFPDAEAALCMAAEWAQEAAALLNELGAADAQACAGRRHARGLLLSAWRVLPPVRAANVLRYWFAGQVGQPMPASLLRRLMDELPHGDSSWHPARKAGCTGSWHAPGGQLVVLRGELRFQAARGGETLAEVLQETLTLCRAGRYRLRGWGGVLHAKRVSEGGLPLDMLKDLRVARRTGGERLALAPGRPARSLKKQYQALDVPASEREGPLLWRRDTLLFAAGLGVNGRAWADPGQPQLHLLWVPDQGCV